MFNNRRFFVRFWPIVAQQVTSHRAGADADILPLLRRLRMPRGARVLDVPCGYGRHAVLLARRGYRVSGVDISTELLKLAREAARAQRVDVDFRHGDMRRLRFRNRFDLALNLFTSFGYFGDGDDQLVLDGYYRALRPGGWLVLHVINRDFIMRHYRPHGRARRLKGFRLEERGKMDWATSVIRTEWTVTFASRRAMQQALGLKGAGRRLMAAPRMRGVTHLRVYSCHELQRMLKHAGFRGVQAFGGLRGEAVSIDRRWLTLVASK